MQHHDWTVGLANSPSLSSFGAIRFWREVVKSTASRTFGSIQRSTGGSVGTYNASIGWTTNTLERILAVFNAISVQLTL